MKGKYLFINSEYDWWAYKVMMQMKCLTGGKHAVTFVNCSDD